MLSEEILLKTFSYADKRDVIAAAHVCRHWRGIIRGPNSALLLRGLVEANYPSLLLKVESTGISYDLFLRTERLYVLADKTFRGLLSSDVKSIRESDELFGLAYEGLEPYASPTSGTTTTAIPNATGRFSESVYYDWGANWHRVSELVETREVQSVLMRCVNEVTDGYYFDTWDEGKIWPFLFNNFRHTGNGEEEALLEKFLPRSQVRELNGLPCRRPNAN